MRVLVLSLALLLSFASDSIAREVIERFLSSVTVNSDGSLNVTEEIVVNAEGRDIRRGIYRDFPTNYTAADGTAVRVGFDVTDVERDGRDEPYVIERLDNGVRVRIGSRDALLGNGEHAYTIKYRTTRQLGFFADYDELYWNVTGNGWRFPIIEARVNIQLPDGASISQAKLYTGYQGQTGSDAMIKEKASNRFAAATVRDLQPGEGFTVAVAWQKGLISAPTPNQRLLWWLQDNLGYLFLTLTVLGSLLYYLLAWLRVGRDPPGGTIVPLFYPPEGLGPAAVRYIRKQNFDNEAFASAVVGLAVKGRVKIDDDGGEYTITRLADSGPKLTRSETSLYGALPDQPISLNQENHRLLQNARERLRAVLAEEYKGSMFVKNIGWIALGAVLSVVGLLLSGFFMPTGEGGILTFTGIFAAVWWGVLITVGYSAIKGLGNTTNILSLIGRVFRLLFLVPFGLAGVAVPGVMLSQSAWTSAMLVFLGLAAALGVINLVFFKLMPAPTPAGRRTLDQIEGFRMYLATAEEKRLAALHPPEKTPELFERYLPYAMALDCENQWNARFASILAAAAAAGSTAPVWYGGTQSGWNTGGFASGLSKGLSSSIASASTPPGSVSGSGGGGWSGGGSGGGGGGGGGGW